MSASATGFIGDPPFLVGFITASPMPAERDPEIFAVARWAV